MINLIVLEGRLTREPKYVETAGGSKVCELYLASNRRIGRGEEAKDIPCYVTAVVFGKRAESCSKLKIGETVVVEGALDYQSWETDGKKNSTYKIRAHDIVYGWERIKEENPDVQ